MSKRKYGAAEQLIILNEVSSGQLGFLPAAKTTLMKWQRRYKLYGYEGLESVPIIEVIVLSLSWAR